MARVEFNCAVCNKKVTDYAGNRSIYCSKDCYNEYRARPLLKCDVCSKTYRPSDGHNARRSKASFRTCSNKCRLEKRRTGKYVNCKHCDKKFYVKKGQLETRKFCSMNCSHLGMNRAIGKRHPKWVSKTMFVCDVCGKIIKLAPGQINCRNRKNKTDKIYCSIACKNIGHSNLMTGDGNTNWLGGISKAPYGFDWTNRTKKRIRELDKYICQICGKTQEEQIAELNLRLDVHHIDGNKKNCEDDNLVTLCHICHVKLERSKQKPDFEDTIKRRAINNN